ncbi:carboxypeptidase-like regulatory domain-containing protein [Aquimarina algiphila]|uniref:carboxypeptidase-like regulatory domain-containing protein n=1 Tax=Aquimarina algiphila TaxID=2047982 RepID=UPI00232F6BE9|nr:carboxypeptidase-like regulatory domain-containing protein [Aquimarina algiphila]
MQKTEKNKSLNPTNFKFYRAVMINSTSIKLKIYLSFFLLLSNFINGQTIIEGQVTDSLLNPIAQVSVVLKSDTSIITYAYTDESGFYKILTNKDGIFTLDFSSLSFQKIKTSIQITSKKERIVKNVTLVDKTFVLDEIIIKADIPIKVKKDTIVFNASSFTDGTEEVTEDLLKKIPGIDISKDGDISIQGKSVDKVMIEGDDLFEKGYKLLTKNLNADVIDKIEVLQNFSSNPLLKGIGTNTKTALNLTLKEDRKTQLFGNATLGYGTSQFYENRVNLISFNSKTKYYLFGNLNNVGIDPTGDISQIINPNYQPSASSIGDEFSAKNLINIDTGTPNIKKQRINFNNTEFASFNGIYNSSEKLKIKGLALVNIDENDFFRQSEIQFLIPNNLTNTENIKADKKSITGFGKLDVIYNINDDSRIEYIGKYNTSKQKSNSGLLFNNEVYNQRLLNKSKFTDHKITYTNRITSNNVLLIRGRYFYDRKPQNYFLDTFLYEDIFPDSGTIENINQKNTSQVEFLGIEGNYIINRKNKNIDIKLGYKRNYEKFFSSFFLIDSSQIVKQAEAKYNNDFTLQFEDIYGEVSYLYRLKRIGIRTTLKTHQLLTTLKNNKTSRLKPSFYTVPSILFNWSINKRNSLSALYKYDTKNITLSDIYSNFALTNFRNFRAGTGGFEQLTGSIFLTNYTYGDWADEFIANASFLYRKNNKYQSTNTEIARNFSLSEKIILNNGQLYTININADKFINKLSSNIKIRGSHTQTSFQNSINNERLRDVKTSLYTYGIEMRSAFSGVFNFHVGTDWTTSIVETSSKNTNTDVTSFLDFTFNISEKITCKLKNERYYFRNLNSSTYYFSDFEAQYIIKKNALTLKLTAQNLWNTDSFANYSINDQAITTTEYRLLPRYFLLKLNFRF